MISLIFTMFLVFISGCLVTALTMAMVAIIMNFLGMVVPDDRKDEDQTILIATRSATFGFLVAAIIFFSGMSSSGHGTLMDLVDNVVNGYVTASVSATFLLITINAANIVLALPITALLFALTRYVLMSYGLWSNDF